jgi:hypothetical protein
VWLSESVFSYGLADWLGAACPSDRAVAYPSGQVCSSGRAVAYSLVQEYSSGRAVAYSLVAAEYLSEAAECSSAAQLECR